MGKESKLKEHDEQEKKRDEKPKGKDPRENQQNIALVRIITTDIPATLAVYPGLTRIKGISWPMAKATCHALKLDGKRKISSLSPEELEKIETFIKNPQLPEWMLNRRKDTETGVSRHLVLTDLDLQREFDIRKMKKMRCFKGVRHMLGQPVRGQSTKAHFRVKGKAVGVSRVKAKPGSSAAAAPKKK